MDSDNQEVREYKTKTNGHRISQYYTLFFYCSILLLIPFEFFDTEYGWMFVLGCVAIAAICTYLPRLFFRKMRITRVYIGETFIQVTAKVVQKEDITRVKLVKRPGLFGREIQFYASSLNPVMFAALEELEEPEQLIEDTKEALPGVPFIEEYANYHFLDWGLVFTSVALVWMIVWRIFF